MTDTTYEYIVIIISILLFMSIMASKISLHTGIPALLIFLCIGMLAGSDGIGGIYFDNPAIAQYLGVTSLIFILFSGGLDTQWKVIRPILWPGLSMATLGTLVTTILVALFAYTVLHLNFIEGLLLGAIVSPTDAAAVFMTLRGKVKGKETRINNKIQYLIELESGTNDPMAVFLTTLLVQTIAMKAELQWNIFPLFILQMSVGVLFGVIFGKVTYALAKNLQLHIAGLYPVVTISMVLLNYGLCHLAHGNGFLSVYIMAIVLGNQEFSYKQEILNFHDGLAWLLQIIMFLTLGLLVFPSKLPAMATTGLWFAFFLILIARPLATFLSLALSGFNIKEKLMISWLGLRGAVPIILATYPLLAKIKNADIYFDLVFFIVLTSALVQGPLIQYVANIFFGPKNDGCSDKRRQNPGQY